MPDIQRQRVIWTGFQGAPGLSTYYFLDAASHQAGLRAFLSNMKSYMPPNVTMTVEPNGDTLDYQTGVLTGGWTGIAAAGATGTSGTQGPAPTGMLVRWETGVVLFGHRVRGKTYFVPIAAQDFQADGTIADAVVTQTYTWASALPGAVPGNMQVWTRPTTATPSWTDVRGKVHPARGARAGAISTVNGVSVPDKSIVLTSRRD